MNVSCLDLATVLGVNFFLLRAASRALDLSIHKVEINLLRHHMIIVNFIGPKTKINFRVPWSAQLNHAFKIGHVIYKSYSQYGFVYLRLDYHETTKHLLIIIIKYHS